MGNASNIQLLLIDDDHEFHRKARALSRLRFQCTTVSTEQAVLEALEERSVDIIVIDLALASDSSTRILSSLKEHGVITPVIAITANRTPATEDLMGSFGVKAIVDKPVNLDELSATIMSTLQDDPAIPYHEPTVAELMISPELYPRLFLHESVTKAIKVLKHAFFEAGGDEVRTRLRSALVFDKEGRFRGIVHLDDILRLIHPDSFTHSPYMSGFTGMFMNQARNLPKMTIEDLLRDQPAITVDTPIMEAVHLMLENGLINIPVVDGEELVGVVRDKDIILEIARVLHVD